MTLKNVQGVMGSCTHFKNITIDKNVKTGLLKDGVRVKDDFNIYFMLFKIFYSFYDKHPTVL